ncbi:MAG: phosphomannomutase/phosphoglucomutase [Methylococcaceae bacterium]|nr:phosphomannomutase/phosphoglucomutase [Methylococcaceae bacterium]
MVRIFSILSALTALMLIISGSGVYWLSRSDVNQANEKATEALAKGITSSITSQVNILQESIIKIAQSPEALAAIESKDKIKMAQTATMLEQFTPQVMKLRLISSENETLDKTSIPHMGNADFIMVQESLSLVKRQLPVVQGQGKNRHLALTSVIKKDGEPVGVVLASLKFDFLQSTLNTYQIPNSYIELKQNQIALAAAGNSSEKIGTDKSIKIPGTSWAIHYWHTTITNQTTFLSFLGMIIFPAFLSCLACFIVFKKLTSLFHKDQESLLSIIKDLVSGKNVGSYPMHFDGMKEIGSNIIQLNHGVNHQDIQKTEKVDKITKKDSLDQPLNPSFLGSNINVEEIDHTSPDSNTNIPTAIPKLSKNSLTNTSPSEPKVNKKETIFKANDIRGIAGETLSKEVVFNIGRAIGSEAKEQQVSTIVIGRDARISSPELAESLAKGVASTGVNILDLGLVPSPLVYFVAHHSEGKSGVVITGSHNPPEYNGLKIIINGKIIADDKLKKLATRIDKENFLTGKEGSIEENTLFINEYIGIISEDIHLIRPMKVVVDSGNGAAGKLAPLLLKTLGCEVIELFCEFDGTFPNHHPDPNNSENLTDLIKTVQENKADVGVAFDGDGDRLGVVDSKGNIIWPDRQMMLFAKDVLTLKPGSEIIYDVKCSRHLGEQIIKNGGRPLMCKTGHSFMKAKIKETGAALAGEMSGHIFFNDRWFGFDDALYAASRLIEILSADTRNSADVFADFPDSINTPEILIELSEEESLHIMDKIFAEQKFSGGKIIKIDGMRVEFTDGWGLVRTSNSLPALTLRFEADNTEALQRIQSKFKALLVKVKPDIALPF